MEGARQTTPGQPAGSGRCARTAVLFVHYLHDRAQRRQARPRIRATPSGPPTWITRADLHTNPGLVGIGLFLVRLVVARRLLRRGWLVRRRWCLGKLVTR